MTDFKQLLAEWADDFEEASQSMPTRLQKVILKTRAQECRDMLKTLSDASNAVAHIHRNEAGQISIKDPSGNSFDMSKHIGAKLYKLEDL